MRARVAGKPASNAKRARILIVDDHPTVRQGLAQTINSHPDLWACAEAADAAQAVRAVGKERPDLVITDLTLGARSGLELIKELKSRFPGLPILVLSMHDESFYAERALRAGAKGYIMKQEATEKVVDAARRVLRGEIHLSEKTAARLLSQISTSGAEAAASPLKRLSNRELEIFGLIGSGYGTRQIAQRLSVSAKTVETHRQHIKEKLRLGSSAELVRHAIQWSRVDQ